MTCKGARTTPTTTLPLRGRGYYFSLPLRGRGYYFSLPLRGRDREGVLFEFLCDLCG